MSVAGSVRRPSWAAEPVLLAPEVDVPGLSDAELVEGMREAQLGQAMAYADDLLAIARLAARRVREAELAAARGRGGPGVDARSLADPLLSRVREDFLAELALTRGCSEDAAGVLLREALLLTGPLVPVWSHLWGGVLTVPHVKAVVDLLGDAAPEVASAVLARVLPQADGMTAAVFRDRLRYHLYRVDAEARERRRRDALRRVGVFVRRFDEGVSELVVQGPTPAVHAAADAVDTYARLRRADGDARPIGLLRAETALDLVLRPWDTTRPPVTAHLVLHASVDALRRDGDPAQTQDPGDLGGQVVSAAECRDLLRDLDVLDLGTPPVGVSALVAVDHPVTGRTLAVATRPELARAARGPGLRPPPDTAAYHPTAAQQRFLRVRDRHCRMPGCRRRPGRCDLDHVRPHAEGGPTACRNLCCLCRRHHRIKTHAPGWSFSLRGRTLVVRTPGGVTRTTDPPGWYPDPEPDPPWLEETAPADPLRT